MDIHTAIYNAVCMYFADKDALKGSLVNTLTEVEPTRLLLNNIMMEIIIFDFI